MKQTGIFNTNFIILFVSSLLFIPFLGGVHLFDWDEINFAESAREMIATGDYLTVRINYLPFWEKPPLFIWMQVLSMKIFGINEFAARFPNALCGIATLIIIYNIGKKLYGHRFGIIWVISFAGSILPFLYFKSGIIDPWFNLFIFCGIYFFIRFTSYKNMIHLILSAFSIGLAILTKGPVAFLIFLLVVLIYWVLNRFRLPLSLKNILVFSLIVIVVGGFWFLLQILSGNLSIIKDFIIYQVRLFKTEDAGHGGFLFYHFVILLLGVFPASVFALNSLFSNKEADSEKQEFLKWMKIIFWVILILFTIVRTKIVHYSSLCYFPITYFAAITIYRFICEKKKLPAFIHITISIIGTVYIIILSAFPFLIKNKELFIDFIKDKFAKGNLNASVNWTGFESFISIVMVIGIILFIIYSRKKQIMKAVVWLFGSLIIFICLTLIVFIPKIEKYSQRAAIDFFDSIKNGNAYIATIGYKSYAHLFYGAVKQPENADSYDLNWLLTGDIDKKVYFSSKVTKKNKIQTEHPNLELLYEKNGFVFWVRKPEIETTINNK
jgi:hypothetical protein